MGLGVELLGGEGLGVQIIGDRDIVVSSPESGFSITYRKDGLAPCSWLLMASIAHRAIEGEILGASMEGGLPQARSLGWLSS